MYANTEKGISLVVFFLITFILGNLPLFLITKCKLTFTKTGRGQLILEFFNCFAGGVFLGTCLLNMLTEGQDVFDTYKESVGFHGGYPYFQVGVGLGFFLVALIDKASHTVALRNHSNQHSSKVHSHGHAHAHTDEHNAVQITGEKLHEDSIRLKDLKKQKMPGDKILGQISDPSQNYGRNSAGNAILEDSNSGHDEPKDTDYERKIAENKNCTNKTPEEDISVQGCPIEELLEHSEYDGYGLPHLTGFRAVLLLVAMSFHTIFDGLAVGLQETETGIWSTSVAISIHKAIVAVCLGLELTTAMTDKPRRVFLCMLLFSFMTPTGVAIGMGVTSGHVNMLAQLLVASILQALATGVFFYVTFLEVLGPELLSHHLGLAKVMVAALGFGVISGIKVLDTD